MIKNNIIALRDKAGMTAYQLAKQCGFISNNHVLGKKISDAEKGKNITIETAFLIYTELKKLVYARSLKMSFGLNVMIKISKTKNIFCRVGTN